MFIAGFVAGVASVFLCVLLCLVLFCKLDKLDEYEGGDREL